MSTGTQPGHEFSLRVEKLRYHEELTERVNRHQDETRLAPKPQSRSPSNTSPQPVPNTATSIRLQVLAQRNIRASPHRNIRNCWATTKVSCVSRFPFFSSTHFRA